MNFDKFFLIFLLCFCDFFEFTVEKGCFEENGERYTIKANDNQSCFAARYGNEVSDFQDSFSSMYQDYIDSTLDDYDVQGDTYSEMATFIEKNVPDLVDTDTYHVMRVIDGLEELEDDVLPF